MICSLPRGFCGRSSHGESFQTSTREGERAMAKVLAVLFIIASFLLVAPVIESGTTGSSQLFQAVGTAGGGGGEKRPAPTPGETRRGALQGPPGRGHPGALAR